MQQQKAKQAQAQLQKDLEAIDSHIQSSKEYNALPLHKTKAGTRYIVYRQGAGCFATSGKTASVNYTGTTLGGHMFDTSLEALAKENNIFNPQRKYEPLTFVVGKGQMIKGWEELFPLLQKGAKVKAFIPSGLAYGSHKVGEHIPANSVLVFDLELLEVK